MEALLQLLQNLSSHTLLGLIYMPMQLDSIRVVSTDSTAGYHLSKLLIVL